MDLDIFPEFNIYSKSSLEKKIFFKKRIGKLFLYHFTNSNEFKKMMLGLGYKSFENKEIEDLPFLPVRLFKLYELITSPRKDILKIITSSGTSGQNPSKIFLDRKTSRVQSKILTRIVSSFIGSSRLPMIIIDSESTVKDRSKFSARTAGINGFSLFSKKKFFALNDDMSLNIDGLKNFIVENKGSNFLIFGFTYIVHEYFCKELLRRNISIDFSNGTLIHGGGWKKMINISVDNQTFRKNLKKACKIDKVHDYYGMVEQTGTIYMECEKEYFHVSEFSEVIIRDPDDFSIRPFNKKGIIQLLSLTPISYPGQSLLTEDMGYIVGEDNCKCGRKGKYFKISGRMKNAEVRGCSDTL